MRNVVGEPPPDVEIQHVDPVRQLDARFHQGHVHGRNGHARIHERRARTVLQFAAHPVVGVIDHCVPIGGVAVLRKRLYVW